MMNKTTMSKMISESERRSALPINEDEITEEMIADRLKNELALFKKGTKSVDKGISKRPKDREVHSKEVDEATAQNLPTKEKTRDDVIAKSTAKAEKYDSQRKAMTQAKPKTPNGWRE